MEKSNLPVEVKEALCVLILLCVLASFCISSGCSLLSHLCECLSAYQSKRNSTGINTDKVVDVTMGRRETERGIPEVDKEEIIKKITYGDDCCVEIMASFVDAAKKINEGLQTRLIRREVKREEEREEEGIEGERFVEASRCYSNLQNTYLEFKEREKERESKGRRHRAETEERRDGEERREGEERRREVVEGVEEGEETIGEEKKESEEEEECDDKYDTLAWKVYEMSSLMEEKERERVESEEKRDIEEMARKENLEMQRQRLKLVSQVKREEWLNDQEDRHCYYHCWRREQKKILCSYLSTTYESDDDDTTSPDPWTPPDYSAMEEISFD